MFKRHSLAVLGLLAATTTTTTNDCSLNDLNSVGSANPVAPTEPICSELSPDIQASDGWRNVQASQTAEGELFSSYKARPTVAGLNGLLAIAPQPVDAFSDAAVLVRFADNGLVDARNGSIYDSDIAYPYEPGVWYDVVVSADLTSQVYSVDIGRCGGALTRLISNAEFRSDAPESSQLTHWAIWSSQSATLDVVAASWGVAGSCQPSSCQSLGRECGTASDGCGGILSCGDCPDEASAGESAYRPALSPGDPYAYVTPADIGVTVGVGVVGPTPTEAYSGDCSDIPAGTTIENKIINCGSSIKLHSNVTIRNTIINSTQVQGRCLYFDRGSGAESANVLIEYVDVNCPSVDKVFEGFDEGSGFDDHRNFTLRNSAISGGHDYFFIKGQLDGWLIQDNVFEHFYGAPNSTGQDDNHGDGFQISEGSPNSGITSGTITVRGNYFEHGWPFATKTALIFSTGDSSINDTDIVFESNRVTTWGFSPLWCEDSDSCTFRYNVFSDRFRETVGQRCNNSSCTVDGARDACCGWPALAMRFGSNATTADVACNIYEDGDFLEDAWISPASVSNETADCPPHTSQ